MAPNLIYLWCVGMIINVLVVCHVATNHDDIDPLAKATRWKREVKQRVDVPQPKLFQNYNKYTGGVDQHDWLIAKYGTKIRGKTVLTHVYSHFR